MVAFERENMEVNIGSIFVSMATEREFAMHVVSTLMMQYKKMGL
jgi:hypothetical protein